MPGGEPGTGDLAQTAGRDAEDPAEVPGEMALVVEAGLARNLVYRKVGTDKQSPGLLCSLSDQVLVRRDAGGLFEHPREMVGAHVSHPGEFRKCQIAGEIIVYVVGDSPKRVLGETVFPVGFHILDEALPKVRVVPEQVNRQYIRQRFGVESISRTTRFQFRE